MLLDLTVHEFLAELASDQAVPGGGSASALAGAAAGCLIQMVARISVRQGEKPELQAAQAQAEVLTAKLSHLVQQDAEAFAQVLKALRMPKATHEERSRRARAVQLAYTHAAAVPLEVMELGVELLQLVQVVAEHGTARLASDACVAGQLSWAAVQGAAYNVRVNLPGIMDQEFVAEAQRRMEALLYAADQAKQEIEKCFCRRAETEVKLR